MSLDVFTSYTNEESGTTKLFLSLLKKRVSKGATGLGP